MGQHDHIQSFRASRIANKRSCISHSDLYNNAPLKGQVADRFGLATARTSNRIMVVELDYGQAEVYNLGQAGSYFEIFELAYAHDDTPHDFQKLITSVSNCQLEF